VAKEAPSLFSATPSSLSLLGGDEEKATHKKIQPPLSDWIF
jgi:hypothetical protein